MLYFHFRLGLQPGYPYRYPNRYLTLRSPQTSCHSPRLLPNWSRPKWNHPENQTQVWMTAPILAMPVTVSASLSIIVIARFRTVCLRVMVPSVKVTLSPAVTAQPSGNPPLKKPPQVSPCKRTYWLVLDCYRYSCPIRPIHTIKPLRIRVDRKAWLGNVPVHCS